MALNMSLQPTGNMTDSYPENSESMMQYYSQLLSKENHFNVAEIQIELMSRGLFNLVKCKVRIIQSCFYLQIIISLYQ